MNLRRGVDLAVGTVVKDLQKAVSMMLQGFSSVNRQLFQTDRFAFFGCGYSLAKQVS
jgi:hypothetical protein